MFSETLKKITGSLFIAIALILSAGFSGASNAQAQYRDRDRWRWQHRDRDRDDREFMEHIRRLDRDRQVRYRTVRSMRTVGYYDRFGRFHAYGFYDRFGRFHRY